MFAHCRQRGLMKFSESDVFNDSSDLIYVFALFFHPFNVLYILNILHWITMIKEIFILYTAPRLIYTHSSQKDILTKQLCTAEAKQLLHK